ncbi:MAG: NifU family protein [Elusimicrobia bacterium]|nr:NifU family protein [Elusimicrobiota bacterium]
MSSSPVKITGQVSADPNICTFTADVPLHPEDSYNCASPEMAKGSPLLEELFRIPGVRQVLVAGNSLTVEKVSPEDWPSLGKKIGAVVRAQAASGRKMVNPELHRPELETHIRRRVSTVLESEINPTIAAHGGRADVVDVRGTIVHLRFSGGCQGCGSAQATLRQGIERAIFSKVPEVTTIHDVTDHAAGLHPYYPPNEGGASPLAGRY